MATLHVAIGRRLGWQVSLAAAKSHLLCRYDDGQVVHNIEATQSGYGGFKTDPDDYLMRRFSLPDIAVVSGSDLRTLSVREMVGVFVGFRGRHLRDTGHPEEAEGDYLLARRLYPTSRRLYREAAMLTLGRGETLFDLDEFPSAFPARPEHWLMGASVSSHQIFVG